MSGGSTSGGSPVAVHLETAEIALDLVPKVGSKIVSLVDRRTGRQWAWRNPDRPLVMPQYAGSYEDYDMSGIEDCFPAVGPSPYPTGPWAGIPIPGQGEWWALRWDVEATADSATLRAHGIRFPYHVEKRVSIEPGVVRFAYRVENPTPYSFPFVWSAHPLLAVTPDTRVVLPEGVRVLVDSSVGGRLGGYLAEHDWPRTRDHDGWQVDLSIVSPGLGFADKLYAVGLPAGWCALHDRVTGDYIAFTFDLATVPYVGVWLNQGGYPGEVGHFNVGLEPCSGYPDRLDVAYSQQHCQSIGPRGTHVWEVLLHLGRAAELPLGITGLAAPLRP